MSPDADDVLAATEGSKRCMVSFWDAMTLVAARVSGATMLWSEAFNHGWNYDGVVVHNPFLPS